ncbi:MAG: hypothetical protein HY682_05665 [Chloroflexi bacterium]|nr:hypothetical protein [Chloroflexota bacterium]
MPAVPDASSLIALGKLEQAGLLQKLYSEAWIVPRVWEEAVTKGKAIGARDAAYLERMAPNASLVRIALTPRERRYARKLAEQTGIGSGEAEVLAVAKSRRATAVLDEKAARSVALALGVAHIGTIGLLYEAYAKGILGRRKFLEILEALGKIMWISPELLARILRRTEVKE